MSAAAARTIAGGCLCGAVRFSARGGALFVAHCHCESCRRHTSAPVATYVGYPSEQVQFTRDAPAIHRSSAAVRRGFCARCGSPLSYESAELPGETHLFWAGLDEPQQFQPTRHVFYNERLPGFDLYDDLPRYAAGSKAPVAWGAKPAVRVLFLCTGNSARSIIAEAIVSGLDVQVEDRRLWGHSAGSQPSGVVNPNAIALLQSRGYATRHLRSKSWDEFTGAQAPPLDEVITLCDAAAAEPCPAFPGTTDAPQRLHWGLPDPVRGEVSFEATYDALYERIGRLVDDYRV